LITYSFEEEIREAIWQCDGKKSLRPDGFNLKFIKNCWEVLNNYIFEAVSHFQDTESISKGCNASFIALVPKVSYV